MLEKIQEQRTNKAASIDQVQMDIADSVRRDEQNAEMDDHRKIEPGVLKKMLDEAKKVPEETGKGAEKATKWLEDANVLGRLRLLRPFG